MAKITGFYPENKVKVCFGCKMFDVTKWFASAEKMVPEGHLHMTPFHWHLKEDWKFPQSLDSLLPYSETMLAQWIGGKIPSMS